MAFAYLDDLQGLFLMVSIRTCVAAHGQAMGNSLPQTRGKWLMDNLGSLVRACSMDSALRLASIRP
ncbi:hypothetical protein [Extensimonas sp. H3M7-6]|uniref:hypothetical protein n=1 Tax=Extensimonas soli TaxID=3031322 RepID=UPI0023D9A449|nr:hypothetical protein [Extensimonas sp. H3M7-6]MDF1483539.1 hypothetical protein [Extensimonas sp. H3M7-6]